MPKVSEQYLAERREHILRAARRCFLRNGFHQTSMQDLFAESGLSSGAVYRYFASKEDMVLAIAAESLHEVVDAISSVARGTSGDASLGAALAAALDVVEGKDETDQLCGLAVQVWSEALRNPVLAAQFTELLDGARSEIANVVRRHQRAGLLPSGPSAKALAAVLSGVLPGYILQRALLGAGAVRGVQSAVRALWPDQPPVIAPRT